MQAQVKHEQSKREIPGVKLKDVDTELQGIDVLLGDIDVEELFSVDSILEEMKSESLWEKLHQEIADMNGGADNGTDKQG